MNSVAYFERLARYNRWANGHVYDACATLSQRDLDAPRTAFFPSITATLNHLLVADSIWMSRLLGAPISMPLDTVLFAKFDDLRAARMTQDQAIIDFTSTLTPDVIASDLTYQSVTAGAYTMPRDLVLGHMFNHQTHHRGQLSNMILEAGAKPLEIDLIYYGRDHL
ncbi:DinB family protein [Thalassospira lucentensis]|uniref:DinB family protein n=1 Tax=Thalassospira lucentensis TaxID=168935 RepID=UPI003D2EE032